MKTTEYKNYNVQNGYFIEPTEDSPCAILICDGCKKPIGYVDNAPRTIHAGRGVCHDGTYYVDRMQYIGSMTCPHCKNTVKAIISQDIAYCC